MNRLIFAMATVFVVSFAAITNAHPNHVSLADVRLNPTTQKFEIALCVKPEDLEASLSQMAGKRIRLTESNRHDALIDNYVRQSFTVRTGDAVDDGPRTLRWVGYEVDLKQAWLYFEIDAGGDSKAWQFENRMFFESNNEQINQIIITQPDRILSNACTEEEPIAEFAIP